MHHIVHHHVRRRLLLLAIVILLMLRGGILHAQGSHADGTATAEAVTTDAVTTMASTAEAVLFIGHFTPGGAPDTVMGAKTVSGYLPTRILWGQSVGKPGMFPAGRPRQTALRYPSWANLRGSVALQSINGDSLLDIVVHLQGGVTVTQGERDQNEGGDSLRSVVVFGQSGLDSLAVLDLDGIRRFQMQPFFAVELVRGAELVEPGTRDLSGSLSYWLQTIELKVEKKVVSRVVASVEGSGGELLLFPNPARTSMSVESGELGAGVYLLRLVSVAGMEVARAEITIGTGESLRHTFDVRQVASGYYVVQIERIGDGVASEGIGAVVGSYPIIITR